MNQSEFERAQAAMEQLQQARSEMAQQTYSASSDDGYITVTVDSAGYPVDLEFDPRAFRTPVDSSGIAASVMDCWREAREQAEQRERETVAALEATTRGEYTDLGDQLQAMGRALLGRNESGGSNG